MTLAIFSKQEGQCPAETQAEAHHYLFRHSAVLLHRRNTVIFLLARFTIILVNHGLYGCNNDQQRQLNDPQCIEIKDAQSDGYKDR